MQYKIKVITGYRNDQVYSIDADEAYKAYYLFLNPEKRGVFNNGVAMIGRDIRGIEPDYNGTMGWSPIHKLDDDDWAEIRQKGVDTKLRNLLSEAKDRAQQGEENKQLNVGTYDLPDITSINKLER